MKKTIKTIKKLGREQVAKFLLDYVTKSNLVKKTVARNRGGARENTFNESEVASAANMAIHKVVVKVEEYRATLKTKPKVVQKQFEDIPLLIKYFDRAFDNLLKDIANQAGAQKRARYTEILHNFTSDEVNVDELHGTWDVVHARDHRDILDEALYNLKEGLFDSTPEFEAMMIKIFNIQFFSRITNDEELAREMKVKVEEAVQLRTQLAELLGTHCRAEMNDLIKLVRDNKSHWEVCRDEAKAANKTSAAAAKSSTEQDIKVSDTICEVSTGTIFKTVKGKDKKEKNKVEVTVVVQILRDAGGVKEVAAVVKEFKTVVSDLSGAQLYRKQIQMDIKAAEASAHVICEQRRRLAFSIHSGEAA